MIDFLTSIFECDDYAALLGDLYEPTCSCIIIITITLSFGSLAGAVSRLISSLFRFRGD